MVSLSRKSFNQFWYGWKHRQVWNRGRIDFKSFIIHSRIRNFLALGRSPRKTAGGAYIHFPSIINGRLHKQIRSIGIASWANHAISPFSWLFSNNPARTPFFPVPPEVRSLARHPGRPEWWHLLLFWSGCLPVLMTDQGAFPERWG